MSDDDAKDLVALAASQGRAASVEAAASVFFEERRHLLMLLSHLLQVFLDYCPVSDPEVVQHATVLLRHLVSPEVTNKAGSSLLARLCKIAQVWPRPPCVHASAVGLPFSMQAASMHTSLQRRP